MTRDGTFDFSHLRFVPREFYTEMHSGHIQSGDILVVKDGATTGKTAFVSADFPLKEAVVNEHVFVCDPDENLVVPKYLFFWLWGPSGQTAIRSNYRGAAIGGINQSFADTILVPVPPLPEQQRIAALLTEQMAAVERARAAAEAQLAAAKALPAAYLRAVFESDEAKRWPVKPLADVCDLRAARSIANDGDTDVMAITTACLTEKGFRPAGIKPAKMWARDAAECIVATGEILIARSNTPELVGRVAMYDGYPSGVVASDLTIRISPGADLNPVFLTGYLSFLYLTGYWKARAGGASGSMKKITRSQLQAESIPIPTLPDQQKVAAGLLKRMNTTDAMQRSLEAQMAAINALPGALLRRAFGLATEG
ncbi:MAG: restriction endonuclease subunit S [Anaerolineae bacterium]